MRLAAYEPDIPRNLGALIRLAACLDVPLDIVGPCAFPLGDRELRRAAMDYGALAAIERHADWSSFLAALRKAGAERVVLLTTGARRSHVDFRFRAADVLLLGRESAGVPAPVRRRCAAEVRVPMRAGARSLNVVTAAAMVLGEALRQTGGFGGAETRA